MFQIITNLFLFKDEATAFQVFDYIQDRFTIGDPDYSIIFKLTAPLPAGVVVGDELWLAQQVSNDYNDQVTLTPPNLKPPVQPILGANFDILARTGTGVSSNYKDKEDLVSTNSSIQY